MPKRPRNARPTGGAFESEDSLVTGDLTNRLQILFRPGSDAIERFLNVLDRVRHAETQIAFAEITKGSSGKSGDAGIVEQCVGQFLRWPSGFGNVWENVERTVRGTAGETFYL